MPKLIRPSNDYKRLSWLSTALTTAAASTGTESIAGDLRGRLNNLNTSFKAARTTQKQRFAARRTAILKRDRDLAQLQNLLRVTWNKLQDRVTLGTILATDLELYKLPLDRKRPQPGSYKAWLDAAQELVEGNTDAVALGLPALAEPSVETIQAAIDAAVAAQVAVDAAKIAQKQAARPLNQQRKILNLLFLEIAAYLRNRNRALTKVARRELLRDYGFAFVGDGLPEGNGQDQTGDVGNGDVGGGDDGSGVPSTGDQSGDGDSTDPTTGSGDGSGGDTSGESSSGEDQTTDVPSTDGLSTTAV